jgi:hypothetical protein
VESNTEALIEQGKEQTRITVHVEEDVSVLREHAEHSKMRIEALHSDFRSMMGELLKKSAQDKGADAGQRQSKDPKGGSGGKEDPAAKKHKALVRVKRHFNDGQDVRKQIKDQRTGISLSSVKSTATWIFENASYQSWISGKEPVLWLSGSAGVGKTYLAQAIVSNLESTHKGHGQTSVAYFFFKEDQEDLRSFRNALRCAVVQIAEHDASYCEQIAADISRNDDTDLWEQFFAARYPQKSETHLYLVLDGIDEANGNDKNNMIKLFRQIVADDLNIHLLFTSRPDLKSLLSDPPPTTIEVTREQTSADIRKLIYTRLQSLPRLRKFRKATKKRIRDKLLRNADGMLFVEHMLRRLSAIGRESTVLKDIEKNMPDTLHTLYELMLMECQKGRTHEQYRTLKTLFAMLAFSKRALTLEEAADLIKLTDPGHTFDIEDEIIGRSARILELGGGNDDEYEQADDQGTENTEEPEHTHDDALADIDDSGKTPVKFQERSLREYFRAINVEENGLRTPPSLAHLTVFELIVKLLCGEDVSKIQNEKTPRLKGYAAHYWAHHFVEINLGDINDELAARTLAGLAKIMSNKNNTSGCFESQQVSAYTELDKGIHFLEKIREWVSRGESFKDGLVDPQTQEWIKSVQGSALAMMRALAQGHIENMYASVRSQAAYLSFDYARDALTLVSLNRPADAVTLANAFIRPTLD